ncbi:ASPIC/UnbV domain-containing protein, partial [Escherichia coli]
MKSNNHWIGLKLQGTKSNRDAIGAKVTMKAGSRIFVDEVRSGSSYDSNNDIRLHFGLGSTAKVDSLQVRW